VLNRQHQDERIDEPELEARIQAFELAYRMQAEATDAFDVTREPAHIKAAYGDTIHGLQLLMARRLVERGVRIVQCYHGDVQPWDSHNDLAKAHRDLGTQIDGPIAALLTDLKQRGLFEETLVICGGEFGRTPAVELVNGKPGGGRDHNHWGFDHTKLTYRHAGRDFRLTDVHGHVVKDILA